MALIRFSLALGLCLAPALALAERAGSPAEATVFIRVVGEVRAEYVDVWKQSVEEEEIELGTGSGFVISPYGHVLTNYHVVSGGDLTRNVRGVEVKIQLTVRRVEVALPAHESAEGGRASQSLVASVDAVDPALDLAVLSVSGIDLPYIAFGDSEAVEPAQPVQALGFPFGRQVEVGRTTMPDILPRVSITRGSLSSMRPGENGRTRYLQTSATLNPGNSGGPLVDEEGFALGVVRMKLAEATDIGFAVPINDVKDFLETRGLDQLLPVRRMRLGPWEALERKGLRLRVPEGREDVSPGRLRADFGGEGEGVALRIDRVASPWGSEQIEEALLSGKSFEKFLAGFGSTRSSRPGDSQALVGRARGAFVAGEPLLAMEYAIVDLGREKVVARFVGEEEAVAFNRSVLQESLRSLEARPLLIGEIDRSVETGWTEVGLPFAAAPRIQLPAGWVVEEGAPFPCSGIPPPDTALLASPAGDFTVSFLAAWRRNSPGAESAASACSSRRGALGGASYASRTDYLGVSYQIEGVFVSGDGGLLQLEMVAPVEKHGFVRDAFRAWVARNTR